MSNLALTECELALRYPDEPPSRRIVREAEELVSKMKSRSFPDPKFIRTAFRLEDLLGGGFCTGRGVIEITGVASSGKTQLMLDIALSCPRKTIYIVTEGRFPGERLAHLKKSRPYWKEASLDNVLVSRTFDLEPLALTIEHSLPEILKNQEVDAILIDSITCPFRGEDGSRERTTLIQKIVRQLHQMSKKFNLLVVCVNHVADDLKTGTTKPCLGQSWSKGISGRLFLRIENREKGLRSLTVDWCEDYLNWQVGARRDFYIRGEGLIEVADAESN